MTTTDHMLAAEAKAWPFEEARRLLARVETANAGSDKGYVLFETGYGPSGLPHIGTFGEVARTSMVRHAFAQLSDRPTRLFAFSDDMDGLRKVPDNVPNREMLARHLNQPLTQVPDPFGTHDSFGAHNNARLRAFLDTFGFDYEFCSATEFYRSGRFDPVLLSILRHYDAVMDVMLPTLGPERRATYSPFLPICAETGRVLQVPVVERFPERGTIVYEDEGRRVEVPVTGGHCKVQWKADWAMRWAALGVDYEMYGKDLIPSAQLSARICAILGGTPPDGFSYELFLDEAGQKISKSRGNGLTIDEWLRYAPEESLALYMFQAPKRAKRLYFDVIPRAVDDYLAFLDKYPEQDAAQQRDNPVWHIHAGKAPSEAVPVGFAMLLNLVSASNSDDRAVLWGFLARYAPEVTPAQNRLLDRLVDYAIAYYHDFVKPARRYRAADPREAAALGDLADQLAGLDPATDADVLQNLVYEIGKGHGFEPLRDWFKALYEVLLGESQGPRFGSFIALYGVRETEALIRRALGGQDLAAAG